MTQPHAERVRILPRRHAFRRAPNLWSMIALAVVLHVIVLALASPGWIFHRAETPEQIFTRGEAELNNGRYAEAMQLFQKVLDMQPKLPPVFERAAEQHRTAERLAKQAALRASPKERPPEETSADNGVSRPETPKVRVLVEPPPTGPATKPSGSGFIPPELRGN